MNKIAVITGGASGIGLAVGNMLRETGFTVVVIDKACNSSEAGLVYRADVTDESKMKEVFADIAKKHKQVDVLVNSAGYALLGAVELVDADAVRKQFDVNLVGSANAYKFCLPLMPCGGKVIFLSSAAGLNPLPFRGFYCSSKAAVHMLALSARLECKSFGVQVVSICPGDAKTNFNANRVRELKTNERYGNAIQKCSDHLDKKNDERMPVENVSGKIIKIINKTKNKPLYIIGRKEKFFHFVCRFLPESVKLWILYKMYYK
ncbi:MAG: SDR family NAD(P)-dependent oxidoreductase [Firmicutes bacterium]|nr:SDR family NAD(P)-dependent oxidoreductase [Bacillota bacterium]